MINKFAKIISQNMKTVYIGVL